MNKLLTWLSIALLFVISSLSFYHVTVLKKQVKDLHKTNRYTEEATKLSTYYYQQDIPVNFKTILETLDAIDRFLPRYFPNGPFTREDIIALAMVESCFNQYCTGTSGEKGIFQIMPAGFKDMRVKRDHFDVDINTKAALFVLKQKYVEYKDYKKSIIAYNGVVKYKSGQWSEKYWKRFTKLREVVNIIREDLTR